jgi:hypothetical protein
MEVSGQLYTPAALTLVKEPSGTHWIGGWVGRSGRRNRTPAVQPVARLHTDRGIPGPADNVHVFSQI